MKKTRIIDPLSREEYDKYTFSSGFTLVHYPKKGRFLKGAYLSVGYGSIQLEGEDAKGERFSFPEGTAHFLEHKLFENDELHLIDQMSSLGASVNAFTSHDVTCYYFTAPIHFMKSLKLLLDIPVYPAYTEEGVVAERKIIAHEIAMYQNDVDYRTFHRGLTNLYPHHPIGRDIAGTKESIEKIDKALLDQVLRHYYVPSNMLLFVIGDFSEEEIQEMIALLPDFYLQERPLATTFFPKEDMKPSHLQLLSEEDIPTASFSYLVKLKPIEDQHWSFRRQIKYGILLDVLFGPGSAFYMKHYENNDFLDLAANYHYGKGYRFVTISGEGKKPLVVEQSIMENLDHFKNYGLAVEEADRVKKRIMGRYLMGFNSIKAVASSFTILHHRGVAIFDYLKVLNEMIIDDYQDLFKGPSCFSATLNKEEK